MLRALARPFPCALLVLVSCAPTRAQAADHTETLSLEDSSVTVDFYLPSAAEPAPMIVVAHGFARSRQDVGPWGTALASRGYVVALPDLPGLLPDHRKNGLIVSALLDWMAEQSEGAHEVLGGRVDPGLRGVVGHSAGGLAAVLAAAADPTIEVVVGLDLVDSSGSGLEAAGSITAPAALLMSRPDECNSQGNGSAL
ncbi:MAG: alpha/beta fold hydrolase, partial [Myxococcota bacterium]